jgi:hypothetical protein
LEACQLIRVQQPCPGAVWAWPSSNSRHQQTRETHKWWVMHKLVKLTSMAFYSPNQLEPNERGI